MQEGRGGREGWGVGVWQGIGAAAVLHALAAGRREPQPGKCAAENATMPIAPACNAVL